MLRTLLLGVSLPMLALPVAAQDLPQAQDAWFTAGQEAVAARLANQPITTRAKNVILFTADGNGVGTNYAIRLFEGQAQGGLGDDHVQPHEAFPNVALIKTYTTNGQTPDSAPTASAMNNGIKSKNDVINIPDTVAVADCAAGLQTEVKLLSEIASEMGKSVGVISTARLTHATPAAVYARTVARDWEDDSLVAEGCAQKDIAAQLIDQMQAGVIDVAMGGGRQHFLPAEVTDSEGKPGKRADGRNLMDEASALGATVVENDTDFAALSTAGNNAPILGLFEASHMKYEHDRTGEPTLAEMTEAAINALGSNEEGFYLSIEAGRVDHANHAGNLYRTLTDGIAFNDAIRKAVELTDAEDTLIIVTADHEHAIAFNGYCGRGSSIVGLCMEINNDGVEALATPNLGDDGKPYTVAGFLNGPGAVLVAQPTDTAAVDTGTATDAAAESQALYAAPEGRPAVSEEEASDPDYLQQALIPLNSETHSGADVAAFARGPWAHLIGGVLEQNAIFHVMHHAITAE
ncbi:MULTISPECIES: alkaline phosphatase [unclassified Paracoccus (in: a-proteobacteria)]|uniref:alkaline phosphatase n=1 Tax=unclassified Paracoccus (in: a-proteobacteria) TaxID=2688777 RepID=UPI001603A900|nr:MULTISPECIES: alkaline phosphatase [unclassified Paracoccus (in: a-proteobacteria)]MBB1491325.1 alkaline phosphatase [Paracoccus sp. MC1854]MBB1498103.1 alkaline phosphatase [Paracoccus sp. MC1862]QQO46215.1 alkaline phosphatase [Paracoccus sp. MC1862]